MSRIWTPEMDEMLVDLWGFYKSGIVANLMSKKLGMALTQGAVRGRARRLGIVACDNQGYLTEAEAARQLGVGLQRMRYQMQVAGLKSMGRGHYRFITDEVFAALSTFYAKVPEPSVKTAEAARLLNYSKDNIYWMVRNQRLRAHWSGRRMYIPLSEIDRVRREQRLIFLGLAREGA